MRCALAAFENLHFAIGPWELDLVEHQVVVGVREGDENSTHGVTVELESPSVFHIADVVFTLGYLFAGSQAPSCAAAADANADGRVDIGDPIYTLGWSFLGLAEPPAPGPYQCGEDPVGEVDCDQYSGC